MENHTQHIDLINQYLNKELSNTEILAFENKLKTNAEFNAIYQEHLIALEGIKRTQLKAEIASAKTSYIKLKWIKIIGLISVVALVLILAYNLLLKTETTQDFDHKNQNLIETNIDSISSIDKVETLKEIDSSKKKFVVVKRIVKQVEVDSLTNLYGGITVVKDTIIIEKIGSYTQQEFKENFPTYKHIIPKNDSIIINIQKDERKFGSTETIVNSSTKKLEKITETKLINDELSSFYNSVKKQPETKTINNEKETTITFKEGTVLIIPAKCFIDVNGKLARGKVNIEVTEYYKLSDMLLANLTTKSDGKQLETGGMLLIKALKDNKQLQLKPGSSIEYIFSSEASKKKDMQLFLGEEIKDGVNWTLDNITHKSNAVLTTSEMVLIEEEDVEVPIQYVEEVPVFPGCENGTNTAKKQCFDQALSNLIAKNFNASIAEDLKLTGKHKISTSFKIDKEGEVVDIQASAAHTLLAKEAIRVLKLIPKLKPGKQRDYTVIVPYSLPINFNIDGSTKNNPSVITIKDKTSFEKKFEERLQNKDSTTTGLVGTITANDVSRYAFYGSKLGWINCDHFIRSNKDAIKFKLKIKDANGADVKIVFKSYNSILPSRRVNGVYDFGTVALNEEVVIVAIKMIEGHLFLGITNATTKEISELKFDFKAVSLDQLKSELQKLNNDFN
ncbi:energy transducer TonB [Olleya sp. UBA1516]|uniref:energy transducer TonB n=1 Tax=Olleya sp. UBA1516 TaxID=1947013 RepID=UPI0025D53338|nr:energy transducer TonB [Olleya sp. UBA1516]|tara:strand:- start:7042 stop:9066 length:2025 start_codon:yes stop_codon:yes gene_type:complete